MSNEEVLRNEIESLRQTVQILEIEAESLRQLTNGPKLKVDAKPLRRSPSNFLLNLISVALYPLVAGIFRTIYNRVYRVKK